MDSDFGFARSQPLFDDEAHTQGGVPHLLEHLRAEYLKHLEAKIAAMHAAGVRPAVSTAADAWNRAPAQAFFLFARKFLDENRAVDTFFVDENLGLRLTNGARVSVSPGVPIRGTMQPSRSVPITHGRGPSGRADMQPDDGSIPV